MHNWRFSHMRGALCLALALVRHPQEAIEDSAADLAVVKLDVAFAAIIGNDLACR